MPVASRRDPCARQRGATSTHCTLPLRRRQSNAKQGGRCDPQLAACFTMGSRVRLPADGRGGPSSVTALWRTCEAQST
eukprot:3229960-Pleurochrysis_carterae.AAC.1